MEFRILGPLEVTDGRRSVPLGGAKPRALLAVLLLHTDETVSTDRLVDEIWGDQPPRSATKLVQGYVSTLRRSLGDVIETRSPGYRLRIAKHELDLHAFVGLAEDGRRAARTNDLVQASRLFEEALTLWRGTPLADVDLRGLAAVDAERIAELRLGVIVDRIDVELALGRHAELLGDLDALVAAHPLQERLRGQLMLALYRSGRQADALRVYRAGRAFLVEELGLEPATELRALEAAILRHDASLSAPAPAIVDEPSPDDEPRRAAARVSREERKLATLLAADIAVEGAEHRDPEAARALWTAALARFEQELQLHGGAIEHVVGDRVLALFGIPYGHEDDAERAVRAAVSALDAIREIGAKGSPRIVGRAAVESGDVLVGEDGAGRLTITGPLMGALERLLAAAPAGRVVVGDGTRAATVDTATYRLLEAGQDLAAWEPSTLRSSSAADRRPLGLRASLVGRDAELGLLRHEIELLRSEPRPRLVTVIGAAGVGKSRLAHELLAHVESLGPAVAVRRGRCLAYGNVSYSGLAEAVKAECGILADDPPEVAVDKATRTVERLIGDPSFARHVQLLVGARSTDELSREELFDAWRTLLERVAKTAPLMLVLEDLHWADEGLLDFVDHLTAWAEAPVLVLALARPALLERRPTWGGGKRNATSITLEPLDPEETETLVRELLGADAPSPLTRMLVERSEGNPLFGEEIVRMLIEHGVLREAASGGWQLVSEPGEVEVPRSIRAVIGARLDALPPEEVDVVQAAAVVGRVFWVGAAQRLVGRSRRETREVLGRLRARDIVVAHESSSFSGEPELAFRHVLIRDVAYESLSKSRRVDAHIEMAAWAAERAGGEEVPELLATHYVAALDYLDELGEQSGRRDLVQTRAYHWARAAAERARRLWQQREAARWFASALDAAAGFAVSPAELAGLREEHARAREGVEPYPEVAAAFEAALASYEAIGDDASAGRMKAWRAFVAFQSGDDDAVLEWSERALADLEPYGPSRDLALALVILGWAHRRSGRFDEGEPRLRRALAIAEAVDEPVIRAQASVSLGKCLQQSGQVDEAMPLLERSLELARQAGDLPVLLRALVDVSEAHEEATGDYHRATELMLEGLELAHRAGHRQQVAWMESNLADYLLDMGRIDEAEPLSLSGLAEARRIGEPRRIALTLPTVSYVALLRSQLVEAQQSLDELRSLTEQVDEVYAAVWVPLLAGLLAQAHGRTDDAANTLLEGARRQARRTEIWGAVNLLAEAARSLVRVGRLREARESRTQLAALASWSVPATAFLAWVDGVLEPQPERAREQLSEALSAFERLERRLEVGRCLMDLASVERRLGSDPTPAAQNAQAVLADCGARLFLEEAMMSP